MRNFIHFVPESHTRNKSESLSMLFGKLCFVNACASCGGRMIGRHGVEGSVPQSCEL